MMYPSDIGYKISIITPTFNSQKTIEENIKSVISQKFTNWEQIIIDNCSTDKTLEIVNQFKNQKIKIFSEKDKGIYDALNKGIKKSTGNIISILHSDNFFTPWRFSFLTNKRDEYLRIIRKSGYDASSYYPNIARVFNKRKETFKNSDIIEKKIVNLWLSKNYNLKKVKVQFNMLKNNL